jgi:hypothetical protein
VSLAGASSALDLPLHPDLGLVAERRRDLTSRRSPRRRPKRGSFRSIVDLQVAINRYIAEHNDDLTPFTLRDPSLISRLGPGGGIANPLDNHTKTGHLGACPL